MTRWRTCVKAILFQSSFNLDEWEDIDDDIDTPDEVDENSDDAASDLIKLRHLTNTVFNRSQKLLSLFDMLLMTVINRLLASSTFYFVPDNDSGTNGNSKQNDHRSVYRLESLIITNILFIPQLKPSISVYEIFNTLIFTNNMSYQVYTLPRFLGIDYKRNTSLACHNGDNVMNNCHFRKITFCHVLPMTVHKIEHSCYKVFLFEEKSIHVRVLNPLRSHRIDSDERMNKNIDDLDNDNIIIKKFTIVISQI
ncbi:unnamed protein product [Didymodactylos carnosus]|uniref:Uncharacterized protein n=1 Tax=Didymodactylos carnosus TaxID=1234261 RepID=A0A815DAT6_9BILA|nr:unnamed protein product [Didymodactylos carnosus]CAF4119633.1 unnamed protein product [Didymodactylos carnosus]